MVNKLTKTSFNNTELDDSLVIVCDVFNYFLYLCYLEKLSWYAELKANLVDEKWIWMHMDELQRNINDRNKSIGTI